MIDLTELGINNLPKVFDTHTHYDDRAYKNRNTLIEHILYEGRDEASLSDVDSDGCQCHYQKRGTVAGFVAVGCSMDTIPRSIEIAEGHKNVYAAVGVHPSYVDNLSSDYIEKIDSFAKHEKVKAIGEIGLDYHYDGFNKESQISAFKSQLNLAERLSLPVIIHSRDAINDTMEIIKEINTKAVMHCYSGSVETMRELVDLGIMISVTGVVTFKNAKRVIDVCREVPLDMLMLETDCPYMSPEPFRGKICDSSLTLFTAKKIAEIKEIDTAKLIEKCNDNAKRFFDIDF